MGTKRLVFAIIVVILLIAGVIGGYYYILNGSRQATVLQEEMAKVIEKDLLDEEIDMQIKSLGNYGKVETAVKEYLNDVRNTFYSMQTFCNAEQVEQILSATNIEQDSEELSVVKTKVDEKKQELEDLINKTQNIRDNDTILKALEGKNIKENYIDVFKNIMQDEAVQTKLLAVEEKTKDEYEEAEQRLEGIEDAVEFLEKNTKYWEVNEGKIQFTNTNKLAEYLEVLNGTK